VDLLAQVDVAQPDPRAEQEPAWSVWRRLDGDEERRVSGQNRIHALLRCVFLCAEAGQGDVARHQRLD
jgi:hypothetical protein